MRAKLLTGIFIVFALAQASFAGLCTKCAPTCNVAVGSTWTTSYWPINEYQYQVLSSNPHNDCVTALSFWCSSTGPVLCYSYQQRWRSIILGGTWGPWSSPIANNTNQC